MFLYFHNKKNIQFNRSETRNTNPEVLLQGPDNKQKS